MMDEAYGNWLAGFIDGEGCFRVHKEKGGAYYACHFALKVRADERDTLEEIVARTGIGRIASVTMYGNSKPGVIWVAQTKVDTMKLVELLDRFPLRAKKRRDYAVWREAVIFWQTMKRGHRWHGPRDWTRMIEYKVAIEDARAFR